MPGLSVLDVVDTIKVGFHHPLPRTVSVPHHPEADSDASAVVLEALPARGLGTTLACWLFDERHVFYVSERTTLKFVIIHTA